MTALSLRLAAQDAPSSEALVDLATGQRFTYTALLARAERVGRSLAAQGVRAGDRVTLRATNRVETAAALLAMFDRGVTAVPLHPRLTEAETLRLRDDAEASAHLDDDALDEVVRGANDLPITLRENDIAAMLYTSGTSGRPKGATLPHEALIASAEASATNLGWRPEDRWLLCLPLCHVGGLSVLTRCLRARRPVALLPKFDPDAVLDAIVRDRTTLLSLVPTMLHTLLERDRENALARVRAVLVGGAACPMGLREESAARGIPCLATYGLTEACSQVATQSPTDPPRAREGVGRVLPGLSMRLVDSDDHAVAPGEIGRILLRGKALMRGYRGHPPLGEGWFDTGDHGALDDHGTLTVHGRRTDLIVTGGENVYPLEVELAAMAHPSVAQALVFGESDPLWGQRVAMLVVPRGDMDLDALRGWMAERLAGFKRPRLVAAVDALPTLPSGKPDRRGAITRWAGSLRAW